MLENKSWMHMKDSPVNTFGAVFSGKTQKWMLKCQRIFRKFQLLVFVRNQIWPDLLKKSSSWPSRISIFLVSVLILLLCIQKGCSPTTKANNNKTYTEKLNQSTKPSLRTVWLLNRSEKSSFFLLKDMPNLDFRLELFSWKVWKDFWTLFIVNFDISKPNFRKFWNFWQFLPILIISVILLCTPVMWLPKLTMWNNCVHL